MKKAALLLTALATGHGLNDFIAGFLLARSTEEINAFSISLFTVYSALAFGGQIPAALLIGRYFSYRSWAVSALVLMLAAILVAPFSIVTAILISGAASAIYHVAGGALSIVLPVNSGTSAGIFSAPGVVGLTLGGFFLGRGEFELDWMLLPVAACLGILLLVRVEGLRRNDRSEETKADFDWHDGLMILLLLVIALRSAMWDIYQVVYYSQPSMILWIALAAAAGKIIGGWMAGKYNRVRYLGGSLLLSLLLFQFSSRSTALLLAGIALLQSTIPACVLIVNRMLGNLPAMSNAVVLGLAIVLGAFPYQVKSDNLIYWVSGGLALLCILFLVLTRSRHRAFSPAKEEEEKRED